MALASVQQLITAESVIHHLYPCLLPSICQLQFPNTPLLPPFNNSYTILEKPLESDKFDEIALLRDRGFSWQGFVFIS